jgi:hypothetical protein
MDWPTTENPAKAIIGPTGYGTFGIVWRNFEAMENRGGYSGPYKTFEEAAESADTWRGHWNLPPEALVIERVEDLARV